MLELAVVIPTFNEAANVPLLVAKLDVALAGRAWEAIFVDDDSPDGTANAARDIARTDRRVRVIQRIGRRGLSSACIEGMCATAAPLVAVIDGDLQHDETLLPKMLDALHADPALDVAIGSRFVGDGGAREKSEEKKILEFILNDQMLANDSFVSHIEDNFSNWDDDGEMLVQLLTGYIQKPGSINFKQMMSADKEQFSKTLLQTVVDKNEHLQSLIIPKLKNWDAERIAQLDMIMMKMGVAEFLYFETIPPKVTINEYIDLAKDYSTLQSGQFVNGILDNIHKELVQDGKMQKVDYRKA